MEPKKCTGLDATNNVSLLFVHSAINAISRDQSL